MRTGKWPGSNSPTTEIEQSVVDEVLVLLEQPYSRLQIAASIASVLYRERKGATEIRRQAINEAAQIADNASAEYSSDMVRYPEDSGNREISMRQSMACDLVQRRIRALASSAPAQPGAQGKEDATETMLASEPVLAREWNTPEEDAAWKDLEAQGKCVNHCGHDPRYVEMTQGGLACLARVEIHRADEDPYCGHVCEFAPQATDSWWCCSADYPNHEANCPNVQATESVAMRAAKRIRSRKWSSNITADEAMVTAIITDEMAKEPKQ